jgi:hypothetical protein
LEGGLRAEGGGVIIKRNVVLDFRFGKSCQSMVNRGFCSLYYRCELGKILSETVR